MNDKSNYLKGLRMFIHGLTIGGLLNSYGLDLAAAYFYLSANLELVLWRLDKIEKEHGHDDT